MVEVRACTIAYVDCSELSFINNNLGYGASDYGAGSDYGSEYGYDPYGGYGSDYDPVVLECLANDPSGGHDANAWIKTPGKLTTLSI